jgi:uncharacterized protein
MTNGRHIYKLWTGLAALAVSAWIYYALNARTPRLALFWVFGLAFGFVVQRSRFCFVSAISNFFIFKDRRLLVGILTGLFIATIGFTVIMHSQVSDPSTGIPATAYVAPFGWHLVLAGLIFGLGMMLAGGCILGTLYRIGEGALASLIALLGIVIGMGILQHNWPWWWNSYISRLPNVWLPAHVGWIAAVGLTLVSILLLLKLVTSGEAIRPVPQQEKMIINKSAGTRVKSLVRSIFVQGWPLATGGIVLGLGNILLYQTAQRPWGITGEVMRWSQNVMQAIHIPAPPVGNVPGT